jgi:hypothetical protein
MKVEELVIRVAGGAALGGMLGMILSVAPSEAGGPMRLLVGIAILILAVTNVFGMKYTVRGILAILAIVIIGNWLRPDLIQSLASTILVIAGTLGGIVVNVTTPTLNSAITVWALIGMILSFTLGVSGAWADTIKEIRRTSVR